METKYIEFEPNFYDGEEFYLHRYYINNGMVMYYDTNLYDEPMWVRDTGNNLKNTKNSDGYKEAKLKAKRIKKLRNYGNKI